jgi:phage protein D
LRTTEAADSAAQAGAARAARAALRATVELQGAPQVALGDAVALQDMPDDALNATYQVLGLRHTLDRRRGFRTRLSLGVAA